MNKRGGFELSINFIVGLILAIVILFFGVIFIKTISQKSIEMKETLDQQTEMELERLMDSGEKVSLYPGRREVGNGEMATFGLGVLNVVNVPEFKVIIEPSIATKDNKEVICDGKSACEAKGMGDWIKTTYTNNDITLTIGNNKKEKTLIGILPTNAEKGTYVFDVKVCWDDGRIGGDGCDPSGHMFFQDNYNSLKKIYVKVR